MNDNTNIQEEDPFTRENFDKLTRFVAEIISWDRDSYDQLAEKVGLYKNYDVALNPCEPSCYCVEEGIPSCWRLQDWITNKGKVQQ